MHCHLNVKFSGHYLDMFLLKNEWCLAQCRDNELIVIAWLPIGWQNLVVALLVQIHGINKLVSYLFLVYDVDTVKYFKFHLILDPLVSTFFHPVFISRLSSLLLSTQIHIKQQVAWPPE